MMIIIIMMMMVMMMLMMILHRMTLCDATTCRDENTKPFFLRSAACVHNPALVTVSILVHSVRWHVIFNAFDEHPVREG